MARDSQNHGSLIIMHAVYKKFEEFILYIA